MGKLVETFTNLKGKLGEGNEPLEIAVGLPEGVDPVMLRKVVEASLANSETRAKIYTGKNKASNPRPRSKSRTRQQTGTATVLISGKAGKTYADTLRALKGAIKPEECGVSVQRAKETDKEDIPNTKFQDSINSLNAINALIRSAIKYF